LGSDDGASILPVRDTGRAVVELDQRGLGYSQPKLDCPELTALQFVRPDVTMAGSVEEAVLNIAPRAPLDRARTAAKACRDRLTGGGVDVTAFNSEESADDIEDLRVALGYDQINLFGTSYGTRLALVVLRRHPEHIRAAVLDGVFPPQKGAKDTGEESVDAYGALFRFCATKPSCAAQHPHLKRDVMAIAASLDKNPVRIVVHPRASSGPNRVKAVISGDTFLAVLAYALAYSDGTRLPDMIGEVSQGDFDRFSHLYGILFDTDSTYGMHYSVECGEDEDFSPPDVLRSIAGTLPDYIAGPYLRGQIGDWKMCQAWDVPRVKGFRDPVRSDVPALLLSGGLDWATPPAWAALAARTLSHATTVTFRRLGHQTYFHAGCPKRITAAFLADPSQPVDTNCRNTRQ